MARKSAASLAVAPVTALPSRLNPPEDFPSEEAVIWRAVVATKPIEWFQPDSAPLLVEYCRAVVMCNQLAEEIRTATGNDRKDLLKLRDMEAKRVASMACKMRLTQQSRYTPGASATASKKAGGSRPWESQATG